MEIVKIPKMPKKEYDRLIEENHVCRIAFCGDQFPYIAPFLYVFDGRYLYFLSTKYGKKVDLFRKDPSVAVEIERYAEDLSAFTFVSLRGRLDEVKSNEEKKAIKQDFVDMIRERGLSSQVLAALGHSPKDPVEEIAREDRTMVWKLVGVQEIVALRNQ
jgi:uncharacterized protein